MHTAYKIGLAETPKACGPWDMTPVWNVDSYTVYFSDREYKHRYRDAIWKSLEANVSIFQKDLRPLVKRARSAYSI